MNNYTPSYAPEPPKKSSTGKILLFAGLGCGALVLIAVVAVVALVWTGYNKMANSEGATTAIAFVANSPEAQEELGSPITSTFAGGNFNINNGTGDAEVQLVATGPKGAGRAIVAMHCVNNGPWSITSARIEDGPSKGTVTLK